jgi:DNA-3-methyladenine glycosylase II
VDAAEIAAADGNGRKRAAIGARVCIDRSHLPPAPRRKRGAARGQIRRDAMSTFSLTLAARAPFRLDLTVWALRRRAHNRVDHFEDGVWRRVLVLGGKPVAIEARQTRAGARPRIEVVAHATSRARPVREAVAAAVTRMLGLDRDLEPFYRMAQRDRALAAMAERGRGMKPPRFASIFEAFANAVACQLVSLSAGMHVLNRVSEAYGAAADFDGGAMRSFARPARLVRASEDDLRALGLSRSKGCYLIDLARAALNARDPDFASLGALNDADAAVRMCAMRGVGRWTAEYVLLRGFGRLNVFPGDDVGGQNHLRTWLGIEARLDHARVRRLLERWHPYEGLIYLHLVLGGSMTVAEG